MLDSDSKRPTVPWFLVLAAALGWLGLIALQFITPEVDRDAALPEQALPTELPSESDPQRPPRGLMDTLDQDQRESVELEFNARDPRPPADEPTLVLEVRDELGGEPVPDLAVTLGAPDGRTESLRSDAEGVLRSRTAWGAGTLELEVDGEGDPADLVQSSVPPADLRAPSAQVTLAPARDPRAALRVELPVGPTYPLELGGAPPGLAAHELRATLSSANPARAFDKVHARVRAGTPPWTRFSPLATLVSPGPPWRLTLVTDDGLWSGSALVDSVTGRSSLPVRIDLVPGARVTGTLRDDAGRPAAGTFVELRPVDASGSEPKPRPLFRPTGDEGRFDFRALAPGSYELRATLRDHRDHAQRLTLVAGQTTELDVDLELEDGLARGAVRGRVVSASGTYRGDLSAGLWLEDPPSLLSEPVRWSDEGGRNVGRFEFEEIGEESVEVRVHGQDLFTILPPVQQVSPLSGAELEFVVVDDGPSVELRFEVRAASGRLPVMEFALTLEAELAGETRRATQRTETGVVSFRGLPPGTPYAWHLRADGHAPHWGEGIAPDEDRSEVLRAPLGFGAELVVLGPDTEPLEGAVVVFDERVVGTTDERGRARIQTEAAPTRMRVDYADWVPAESSQVRADGHWEAWQDRITVRLAPPL